MPNPATHEIEEAAPPPFVNGEAPHKPLVGDAAKAGVAPRRVIPKVEPAAENAGPEPGDGLALLFRLQGEWQERMAELAHQQLSYLSEAGREFLTAGEAVAAEPDPARRVDLLLAYGLRRLERFSEIAARCAEALGGSGVAAAASSRRRRTG